MSRIRILTEDVSNRIAAGEVVERPASVVKELIENALDAEALHISIHVERGGHSMIRVTDDGIGMDREDAILCLEAHATSKINTADDIEHIHTFGFRGEALPSISSVSRFNLLTRPQASDVGTEVNVAGGVIREITDVGCAVGTSVSVKNLFFNIPARRKFLRTPQTEEFHISEATLMAALANPRVGFQLVFGNRTAIAVGENHDLQTRAAMLLGKDTVSSMLPVDFSEDDIRVSGLIARPGFTRTSRRDQRTFVNARPVESNTVYHAIRDAYHTLVMKGRYAPVALFIEIRPDWVDVNVHPCKREVRFRQDRVVGSVVSAAIRRALRGIVQAPLVSAGPTNAVTGPASNHWQESGPTSSIDGRRSDKSSLKSHDFRPQALPQFEEMLPQVIESVQNSQKIAKTEASHQIPDTKFEGTSVSAADRHHLSRLRVLGAVADLFLVAEGPDGLVLIDQHAAHERILFEKVMTQLREREGTRQGLLIPVTIECSNADAKLLRKHIKYINRLGFEIEDFGENTFIIHAVPAHFPQQNISGIIRDIVDELNVSPSGSRRADEDQIAIIACKAAVKAHDHLNEREIKNLLHELKKTELPYTCPHGRPTMINISFRELEKRFGRRT